MKKRNPIHAYKRLLAEDVDWDYRCLIALEKKKLQRMHDCIKCNSCLEHKDYVVRDIAICIRLIDIFMEEDAVFKSWLHQSFSGEMKYTKVEDNLYELDYLDDQSIIDFPAYVNVRNERRFFRRTPIKDALYAGNRTSAILSITILRQEKAFHLYHLIREYKLFEWWC
jgi:hypothetical protein